MSYEQFKEFHDKHPDLDNSEYYVEFPETNKSTIRSWKSRLATPPSPPPQPLPTQTVASNNEGFEEQQKHYVQLLMTQTGSKESEFEGVDVKSKILILKNKLKNAQLNQDKPGRASNSSILPSPQPIGQHNAKFGIDPYIKFFDVNGTLQEIKMEIPMSKLMNPVENEKIRGKKE